eukprot:RCo012981
MGCVCLHPSRVEVYRPPASSLDRNGPPQGSPPLPSHAPPEPKPAPPAHTERLPPPSQSPPRSPPSKASDPDRVEAFAEQSTPACQPHPHSHPTPSPRDCTESQVIPGQVPQAESPMLSPPAPPQHPTKEEVEYIQETSVYELPDNWRAELQGAAKAGDFTVLQRLISAGANVNEDLSTRTALCLVSEIGHLAAADLLLKAGANVNQTQTCTGSSPLYVAVEHRHVKLVLLYLQNGANVNQPMRLTGGSPLYIAVEKGYLELATLLL